jgi:cell division protein ZapA (FtsZ GTPase activity inhibitor)
MSDKADKKNLNIDGDEYNINDLSDEAKAHIASIQFVDTQLQQLNNEWAVADTARIGYSNALKQELAKINK